MSQKAKKSTAQGESKSDGSIGQPFDSKTTFGFDVISPTEDIELVFGLVGPTGVDITQVSESLKTSLNSFGYQVFEIRLSDLIHPFIGERFNPKSKYDRIDQLMTQGTRLRETSAQADIVGRIGVAQIRQFRQKLTQDERKVPNTGVAYIIRSFKRPEEVNLYREIYGKAFNLISIYSTRQARMTHLQKSFGVDGASKKLGNPEELAIRLINRDYEEDAPLGQQVGKTFPLADFFITNNSRRNVEKQIERLINLIFGNPYISPTRDEQGMYFAQASALRSLDLSRQVGAAVTNKDGDIVANGCNEVPKFGGGLYWVDDANPSRDFEEGADANTKIKAEITQDVFNRLRTKGWLSDLVSRKNDEELADSALLGDEPFLRDSKLFDVIEFGRAVHAEMAAITQAAKLGVSLKDATLYCTTFPCHLCSRHIVACGIKDVVFIEPYEKSRTSELYHDSIGVETHTPSNDKADFRSFVGVAPRRYLDFFQIIGSRKNRDGSILQASSIAQHPRLKRIVLTYIFLEEIVINQTYRPITNTQLI